MQVAPLQQSEVCVHIPLVLMHAAALHTSWPLPFGTQGVPLQQSSELLHVSPVCRHAARP